jgi:hypothetical protein
MDKIAIFFVGKPEGMSGCHSSGVEVRFKESMAIKGANMQYLRDLLKGMAFLLLSGTL